MRPQEGAFPSPAVHVPEEGKPEVLSVPIYDVAVAAGAGAFVEGEQVIDRLVIHAEWLRQLVGIVPAQDRLAIVQVHGDSMEPTLSPGDLLLVDRRPYAREDISDGIYVVRIEDCVLVKRLQVVLGGIKVISDNPRYKTQTVQQLDVLARVIWAWRGKRM